MNNLNDDLKDRFKKLLILQLSLLRSRDKDFNIKSVQSIGKGRYTLENDLHKEYEDTKSLNEDEKNPTKQNVQKIEEHFDDLKIQTRRRVCAKEDDKENKPSTLLPEKEQRILSPNSSFRCYSDEDNLKLNTKRILANIESKPIVNERQPCRESFVPKSIYKSQTNDQQQLPRPEDMNKICNTESSLQYRFPKYTNDYGTQENRQQSGSRFDNRKEKEINNSPGTRSKGNKPPYHRHVTFANTEISTKYSEAVEGSESYNVALKAHNKEKDFNCTGVREVHNKLSPEGHTDYYTPNIQYHSNENDPNLYKSKVSKLLQKDKTTDVGLLSEKRNTGFVAKTAEKRFTNNSPVSVVLSPRIRKIQNILADYCRTPLATSTPIPVSTTTETGITTEQILGQKVDIWNKLREKLNDSKTRLENEMPSHAIADNVVTKDTKTKEEGFPTPEPIKSGSYRPEAAVEGIAIGTTAKQYKSSLGKSETETRNLGARRTMIVRHCLNRINNLMDRIIHLMTTSFEDGVKNELCRGKSLFYSLVTLIIIIITIIKIIHWMNEPCPVNAFAKLPTRRMQI